VIRSAAIRQSGGNVLDRYAMADLSDILADLKPLLSARYPVLAH